jgi:hypothetical protein
MTMTTANDTSNDVSGSGDVDESNDVEKWLDQLDPATLTFRDAKYFRAVIAAHEAVEAAEVALVKAVAEARAAGDSWTVIGMALDVSRQAAQQRFGHRI